VIAIAAGATIVLGLWVVVDLGGWSYYETPLRVRGYAPLHATLKPSGSLAHPLGVAGIAMLVIPVIYAVRKRWRRLARAGSMRAWLEIHIFCGIVGPALVTLHTAFRFNGLISVAYWSMMAVMLSGFVGRHLYVRMPRTIRGVELSHEDIRGRIQDLTDQLLQATKNAGLTGRVRAVDQELEIERERPVGSWRTRQRLRHLRHELRAAGVSREMASDITSTLAERAQLLRRLSQLNRSRRLFSLWHVFHQPLVYLMFAIAALHVGVAVYFGYVSW
jgi:hypothetical protein